MNSAFGGNQNYVLYALQQRTSDPIDGRVTRRSFLPTLTYDLKTEQDIFYYSFLVNPENSFMILIKRSISQFLIQEMK